MLRFLLHYRGHRVDVVIARDRLQVMVLPALAPPIRVSYGGEVVELGGSASKEWTLPAYPEAAGPGGCSVEPPMGVAGGPLRT